jgi:hypothetical protein
VTNNTMCLLTALIACLIPASPAQCMYERKAHVIHYLTASTAVTCTHSESYAYLLDYLIHNNVFQFACLLNKKSLCQQGSNELLYEAVVRNKPNFIHLLMQRCSVSITPRIIEAAQEKGCLSVLLQEQLVYRPTQAPLEYQTTCDTHYFKKREQH